MNSLRRLTTRDDGQDLLEYGLLASLIAIFCLAAMRVVATAITTSFWGSIAAVNFF
jgi:Flp pilus assembly pilin Flp